MVYLKEKKLKIKKKMGFRKTSWWDKMLLRDKILLIIIAKNIHKDIENR